jgi:hypothetical protein
MMITVQEAQPVRWAGKRRSESEAATATREKGNEKWSM